MSFFWSALPVTNLMEDDNQTADQEQWMPSEGGNA